MMQNEPNKLFKVKRFCLQQMALFKENTSNLQVAWTNTATRVGGFIALIAVDKDRNPDRGCGEEK